MGIAVGTLAVVFVIIMVYVDVHYWECPLMEASLYIIITCQGLSGSILQEKYG